MAQLIDECIVAWDSLSGFSDKLGWRIIQIYKIETMEFAAGRYFPENNESFLVRFSNLQISEKIDLPEGAGFTLEVADPNEDGHVWLAITRKKSGDLDIFKAIVSDISNQLLTLSENSHPHLLRCFLDRVRTWQEFMRKGAQPLSPEAEIGLYGELTLLKSILGLGLAPSYSINSWVGSLNHIQDFEIGLGAIEVKTTISTQSFIAKIGSLEQLDDRLRQPLFLAGIRLAQIENGESLPDVIQHLHLLIAEDSEAMRVFDERLLKGGYISSHANKYLRKFSLSTMFFAEVLDEFPRIIHGKIPSEIKKVSYELDISYLEDKSLNLETTLKMLGVN